MNRQKVMNAIKKWIIAEINKHDSYEIKIVVSKEEAYIFDWMEVQIFSAVLFGLLAEWSHDNEGENCDTPYGLLNYCIKATELDLDSNSAVYGFGSICQIYSRREEDTDWERIG